VGARVSRECANTVTLGSNSPERVRSVLILLLRFLERSWH